MGYKTVEEVMQHSKSKGASRLVLIVIATHADDVTGICHPGRERLCLEAAMEERNLIYCLKQLESIGEIFITRGQGRGNLTQYRLPFQKAKRMQNLVKTKRVESPELDAGFPKFIESERVQDLVIKGAKSSDKKRMQNLERVQDLEERVQDLVIKGAKSSFAYKDIEPSGNHQEPSMSHVEPSDSTILTAHSADVKTIFAFWQEKLHHPTAKLTNSRRKKIQSRLREGYTVEQIKSAIDGCASSPFHLGENNQGQVYDSLELICRNGEKLEWFAAKLSNGHKNGNGAITDEAREAKRQRELAEFIAAVQRDKEQRARFKSRS